MLPFSFNLLVRTLVINLTWGWVGSGVDVDRLGCRHICFPLQARDRNSLLYLKISQWRKIFGLHCRALTHQISRNVDWVANRQTHVREKVQKWVYFHERSCDPVHTGCTVSPWSTNLLQKLTFTHMIQKLCSFCDNRKVRGLVDKSKPFFPIMSQINPVRSILFLMHLIFFHLPLVLPSGLFPRLVPMCFSPLLHCATPLLILVDLTTPVMFGKGKGRKAVPYKISCSLILISSKLRPNFLLNTPFFKTFIPSFSSIATDQVSHP